MSLSAQDRQALGSIQNQITGSDPQLASLMTMFSRLASGEEMPALEDIRGCGPGRALTTEFWLAAVDGPR